MKSASESLKTETCNQFHWLPWAVIILLFAILILARTGFTLLTYPWYFPDSFDWVVNGLSYSGITAPFPITHRAMLLPLLLSLLYRFGLEDFGVYYGTFSYLICCSVIYWGISRVSDRKTGCIAAILFALSSHIEGESAFIGSDLMALALLSGAAFSFVAFLQKGVESGRRFLFLTAACAGLGIHSQYVGAILFPWFIAMLFLDDKEGRLKVTLGRLKQLVQSRSFYLAVIIAVTGGVLPLLPRLTIYHVFYESKVTHVGLVHPHFSGSFFYVFGLFSVFSWPVLLLAICGLFRKTAQESRLMVVSMGLWALLIWAFFAFLYSWYDIRLLIYTSPPVFFFAAKGLIGCLEFLRGHAGRLGPVLSAFLIIVAGWGLMFTASPSLFDNEFMAGPFWSLRYNEDRTITFNRKTSEVFLLEHSAANSDFRRRISEGNVDTLTLSTPLIELARQLRSTEPTRKYPVVFFQRLSPDQYYYVNNRNIMYMQRPVETVPSEPALLRALGRGDTVVISSLPEFRRLENGWQIRELTKNVIASSGPYIAAIVSADDIKRRREQLSSSASFVKDVQAPESPWAMFNGVSNAAEDYTSSPNGTPVTVVLNRPAIIKEVRLHLWDFDKRYYRVKLEVLKRNDWEELRGAFNVNARGLTIVHPGSEAIEAVRITGLYNSDQETNAGNNVLHIKELELVP